MSYQGNVSAGRALNPQCKGQTMESHKKSWVIMLVGKQVKVLKKSHRRGSLKKQDQWVKGQTYNAITCTSLLIWKENAIDTNIFKIVDNPHV